MINKSPENIHLKLLGSIYLLFETSIILYIQNKKGEEGTEYITKITRFPQILTNYCSEKCHLVTILIEDLASKWNSTRSLKVGNAELCCIRTGARHPILSVYAFDGWKATK